MTALGRILAVEAGRAQRAGTVRHHYVSDRPLVLVPLALAGETHAPLAAMVGDAPDRPEVVIVEQPTVRAERLRFAERLAGSLLHTITNSAAATEQVQPRRRGAEARRRAIEAPQVWVPNPGGIESVALLGRMTRLRHTDGPWAVPPSVPRMGAWATWFAEQAEYVDSSLMLAATQALGAAWTTGQSELEDGNLAALMAWIEPPNGMSAAEAAELAENPILCPPAGPATDPLFDEVELKPALEALASAVGPARHRAATRLRSALIGQMRPTWDLVWRGIELLRQLPPGRHVSARWERDRDRFSHFAEYMNRPDWRPQAKRDGAVRGASRFYDLEDRQAVFEAQRAYDDELVMAEYRLAGEAFQGVVVAAAPDRTVPGAGRRSKLRPTVTVRTKDSLHLIHDDKKLYEAHPDRPNQKATILDITNVPGGERLVLLELEGGMGRTVSPPPGTMPAIGEQVTYAQLDASYRPRGGFPDAADTPWTHGGPPREYVPMPEDAVEVWGE